MTTYVLHGGQTSVDCLQTDSFFHQFTELVPKTKLRYLMCYWAKPKNEWQIAFEQNKTRILKQTHKLVSFDIVENPVDLLKKLSQADGLYVAGGDAKPIERFYCELDGIKKLLEGKVYLGSSMGAFMAAKSYVLSEDDQDEETVHQGLGLLPVNVLCHWNVENKKKMKLDLLRTHDPQTPIVCLNEFELVTMYL